METPMLRAQNVIKILLIISFLTSCRSNTNLETDFLRFYFSKNYNNLNILILNSDNSNGYILKTLKRNSKNKLKQDDFIKKILIGNGLKKIKEQTVKNTKWNRGIEKAGNRIKITSKNKDVIYISKPIFINNYLYIRNYS